MKNALFPFFLTVLLAGVGLQADPLTVNLEMSKVVLDDSGAETLVTADEVKPKDLIEYRATYANNSGEAINGLVAEIPVPEGLEVILESGEPNPTEVLLIGEGWLSLADFDEENPLPSLESVRGLRWQLETIPAGGSSEVSFRAVVVP